MPTRTLVTVNVLRNDVIPTFESTFYFANVYEYDPVGKVVVTMKANDDDPLIAQVCRVSHVASSVAVILLKMRVVFLDRSTTNHCVPLESRHF